MKINRIILVMSLLSSYCMLLSSCSPITLIRIQELKQVEAHVDSLKAIVDSEQRRCEREEKSQNELLRSRADMGKVRGSRPEDRGIQAVCRKAIQTVAHQQEETAGPGPVEGQGGVWIRFPRPQKNSQVEKMFQIACGHYNASRWDLRPAAFWTLSPSTRNRPLPTSRLLVRGVLCEQERF